MNLEQGIKHYIFTISKFIKEYYKINSNINPENYFISLKEIKDLKLPLPKSRAQVYVLEENNDKFVSIYIDQRIQDFLNYQNPIKELNNNNLDSWCVLTEEISHFILLTERIRNSRSISSLELEWQAEIDKLLLTNQLLQIQTGKQHFWPLARLFYNTNNLLHPSSHYKIVDHYAARFWLKRLSKLDSLYEQNNLQAELQDQYSKDWQCKIKLCG